MRSLLSLGLLFASIGKITSHPAIIEMFDNWGYPVGFHFAIGLVEIILAVALMVPRFLKWALLILGVLMVGASITHLFHDPMVEVFRPMIFLILGLLVYLLNFRKNKKIK